MKVKDLQKLLDEFDGDCELGIEIEFPQIGYAVKTYDFSWGYDSDCESESGFQLAVSLYGADFDYPAVLRKVKDVVAAIPEEYCAPK